jgi:hypothetical protein
MSYLIFSTFDNFTTSFTVKLSVHKTNPLFNFARREAPRREAANELEQ